MLQNLSYIFRILCFLLISNLKTKFRIFRIDLKSEILIFEFSWICQIRRWVTHHTFEKSQKQNLLKSQTTLGINVLSLQKIHPIKEPVIDNGDDLKSVVLNHKLLPGNNVQLLKVNRLNLTAKVNLH